MWKETSPVELTKNNGVNGASVATVKPVTEEELRGIFGPVGINPRRIPRKSELRNVLSRREVETKELRSRNTELEEIMRKFAPMLLNVATTMGLAAKTEN